MDPTISEFIQNKTLALVGASRDGKSFGNIALKELRQRGYQVLPVHPQAKQINGAACYPDLADLPTKVGGVVVCVPPVHAEVDGHIQHFGALGKIHAEEEDVAPAAVGEVHADGRALAQHRIESAGGIALR